MRPNKSIRYDDQFDYALTVMFDSWIALTALLEASASALEGAGVDLVSVRRSIDRGDAAMVAYLRRDRVEERLS